MSKVIVAGGGAAGMLAAISAGMAGHEVVLYEKNEKLGKKLYITGKGRCNVTNASDMDGFLQNVVTNSRFLYSSFHHFNNQDMMELLERYGCPLKIERGGRVFPVSDRASDVTAALERALKAVSVKVCLRQEIGGLVIREGRCEGVRLKAKGAGARERRVLADAVIVATGGLSYPSTGSTGDGFRWAREAGHQVTELLPALTPIEILEEDGKALQGLTLKNIRASVCRGEKELYTAFGEMLFTHFGVSGPVILSASSYVAKELKKGPLTLSLDLKPALSIEQLDERIQKDFKEEKNRQFKNSLSRLLPARLIGMAVARSRIDPEKPVNKITREERKSLARLLKALPFTITGLRDYKEAVITQGGVAVKEVDPSTMGSKKAAGLYLAGEVLDLDALTGGYNLQIAWSTGWSAGASLPYDGCAGTQTVVPSTT